MFASTPAEVCFYMSVECLSVYLKTPGMLLLCESVIIKKTKQKRDVINIMKIYTHFYLFIPLTNVETLLNMLILFSMLNTI